MDVLLEAALPGVEHLGEKAGSVLEKGAGSVAGELSGLVGDPKILFIGLALIVLTLIIIFFIKKIVINSVLGLATWALVVYVFDVHLPLFASFVVSAVFGLAGIGSLLVLKFLGLLA